MNEDEDRRICAVRAVDIEPFDLGRTVGLAPGLADPSTRAVAVASEAVLDFPM